LHRIRAIVVLFISLAVGFAPIGSAAAAGLFKAKHAVALDVTVADCPHLSASFSDHSLQATHLGKRSEQPGKSPTHLNCCLDCQCCAVASASAPTPGVHRLARLKSFSIWSERQVLFPESARLERPPKRA